MTNYRDFHRRSIEERDAFWAEQAKLVHWHKPFGKVLDYSRPPFAKWFVGGETNLCYNAVDRHVAAGRGDQPALHYVSPVTGSSRTLTYAELLDAHRKIARRAIRVSDLFKPAVLKDKLEARDQHLPLLQELGTVRRILPIVLVPGPVLGAAVPVGHAAGEQDDVRPLRLEEGRDGLVVGPGGLEPTDDLAAAGRPLRLRDPRPQLGEAPRRVRDGERGPHDPGVGVAELGHVRGLRNVEPDEEPGPVRAERRLQLPEPLDTRRVVPHSRHGVLPPR